MTELKIAAEHKTNIVKQGSGGGAQLVERSLPTPEICGSNPNIGKV